MFELKVTSIKITKDKVTFVRMPDNIENKIIITGVSETYKLADNVKIDINTNETGAEKQEFQLGDAAYMIDEDKGKYFYTTDDADFEFKDIGEWVFKSDEERALYLEMRN
jgi:predicted PilT family ATPase